MIGRILRSADFERVLGSPIRARSAHFAVHFLAGAPTPPAKPRSKRPAVAPLAESAATLALAAVPVDPSMLEAGVAPELSTGIDAASAPLVDDCVSTGIWVGYVVPKRHARRAVTRTLLKHQIRHAVTVQAQAPTRSGLPQGLWVVRLRSPFDRKLFPSASSEALREAAARELVAVMADAARRVAR